MQGFNMGRYVPPDQEGVLSGNALSKKHPLGARASKLRSHGTLTVRFEMPFAVWCDGCPQPTVIGQGVRFNAQKKRVGSYHSTPVWSFSMRHPACGGEIEIRTDPQHTAYVVAAGGRKRDTGTDDDSLVRAGEFTITTDRERAEQRETAFGKLEKTIADRQRAGEARERIGELQDSAARQWDDPYMQNQRLRRAFRVGRREREKDAARTEDLRERMSLGIELLPGTEDDSRRAALIDFGSADVESSAPVDKALARPLFDIARGAAKAETAGTARPPGKLKSEIAADKMRQDLVSEIVGNTRAARDPFLSFGSKDAAPRDPPTRFPGLRRKRARDEQPSPPAEEEPVKVPMKSAASSAAPMALVSYDSDSD